MEIIPDLKERIPLSEFSLGWRWDKNHNPEFTLNLLDQIIAFTDTESRRLNKVIDYFEMEGNLVDGFEDKGWIMASSESDKHILDFRESFYSMTKGFDENLLVSWDRTTCVYTQKDTFAGYWDDFCFPSSDDITIVSELTNWILFYKHFETAQFWVRKT